MPWSFRQVYAHGCAVLLAGLFASLFFLALGGVSLCVLSAATFRLISPVVQMFSAAPWLLLMLHYVRYSDSLQAWFSEPLGLGPLGTAAMVPRRL